MLVEDRSRVGRLEADLLLHKLAGQVTLALNGNPTGLILLAVWAIAPVELPLTVAIAKTADVVKKCFEKITTSTRGVTNYQGKYL